MQPRFRTLVWRELPPCARRICLAWSRRLFYTELFFARLYLSWTRSPTWNFVAIAGTLGIFLTVLLFFTPWETETLSAASSLVRTEQKPAWGLDSRLMAKRPPKAPAYRVEFLFDGEGRRVRESASVLAHETPRRRRRSPGESSQPPELSWDVEIVATKRRPQRDVVIADVTWTGRSESPTATAEEVDPFEIAFEEWYAFDAARLRNHRRSRQPDPGDHETVAGAIDDEPTGSTWEPLDVPATAPSILDVSLILSWKSSAHRPKQLQIHNDGNETMERIDFVSGQVPDLDWSQPGDFLAQSVSNLAPGRDESVWLTSRAHRRSRDDVVSILVTAFLGSFTDVRPAVTERPRLERLEDRVAEPIPARRPERPRPIPMREPDRPHLTMTIGQPGRLPFDQMVSAPIRVVNDGNVALYDVVIVAEVPATLEHQYGRRVHYQLRKMAAGEERRATLLLTPLEAGSSTVPLHAYDGNRLAEDSGDLIIDVGDHELAARPEARTPTRRSSPTRARPTRSRENVPQPMHERDETDFENPPAGGREETDAPRKRSESDFGAAPDTSRVEPVAPRKRRPAVAPDFGVPPRDKTEAPLKMADPEDADFGALPETPHDEKEAPPSASESDDADFGDLPDLDGTPP